LARCGVDSDHDDLDVRVSMADLFKASAVADLDQARELPQ
jgi:hypothetical protein